MPLGLYEMCFVLWQVRERGAPPAMMEKAIGVNFSQFIEFL